MFNRLQSFLRGPPSAVAAIGERLTTDKPPTGTLGELYPPNDGTLELVGAEVVLRHHEATVGAILQASSLEHAQSETLIGVAIRNCADRMLILPATRDAFYAGRGGLFKFGLDVALASARKAQVTEFTGLGRIEQRRRETSAWRLACVLAGLCVDLHRVVSLYTVTSPDGEAWCPLRESLAAFAKSRGARYVLVHWRSQPSVQQRPLVNNGSAHLGINAALAAQVVPPEALQFLLDGDPDILTQFFAVISGDASTQQGNKIRPVVEDIRQRVIQADQAKDPLRFGTRSVGTSFGPYFADGLRQLRASGRWTVNDDRARIWIGAPGIFLIWPVAAKEIQEWLHDAKLPGIPRDERTIVELLRDATIIKPRAEGRDLASALWHIRLPNGREVAALKLASATTLFPDGDAPPPAEGLEVLSPPEPASPQVAAPVAAAPSTPVAAAAAEAPSGTAPEPMPAPPNGPPPTRLEESIQMLEPLGKQLIHALLALASQPKKQQSAIRLLSDGRLVLYCKWIQEEVALSPEPMARKLYAAGWLSISKGNKLIQNDDKGREAVIFEPRIAALLIERLTPADLLSAGA